MSDPLYSEKILAHYYRPLNYGLLPIFDAQQRFANPLCGDIITVQLQFTGECISSVGFTHEGCVISRAAASLLSENVKGKSKQDIRIMRPSHIMELLSIPVMPARIKCATLALETIQKMV